MYFTWLQMKTHMTGGFFFFGEQEDMMKYGHPFRTRRLLVVRPSYLSSPGVHH